LDRSSENGEFLDGFCQIFFIGRLNVADIFSLAAAGTAGGKADPQAIHFTV